MKNDKLKIENGRGKKILLSVISVILQKFIYQHVVHNLNM
jgi:predicted ATP-binding protein involved in virulence